MKRPQLNRVPIEDALPLDGPGNPKVMVTMNQGQWDVFLEVAYDQGFYLLELDDSEIPVVAYKKPDA